jgi:hypothetical protein
MASAKPTESSLEVTQIDHEVGQKGSILSAIELKLYLILIKYYFNKLFLITDD